MPFPKPCEYCGDRIIDRGKYQNICLDCRNRVLKETRMKPQPIKHKIKIGRTGIKSHNDDVILCQCPVCKNKEQFFLISNDVIVQCIMCNQPYDKIKYAIKRLK